MYLMQPDTEVKDARYEDRLRFHIENNTSDWKTIKEKLAYMRTQRDMPDGIVVCISRLDKSVLSHYKFDPIKDNDYPL
jgi:adenosyl cobinamide kinase/adenosyl cobinamide phosphate guanylyltransferase